MLYICLLNRSKIINIRTLKSELFCDLTRFISVHNHPQRIDRRRCNDDMISIAFLEITSESNVSESLLIIVIDSACYILATSALTGNACISFQPDRLNIISIDGEFEQSSRILEVQDRILRISDHRSGVLISYSLIFPDLDIRNGIFPNM